MGADFSSTSSCELNRSEDEMVDLNKRLARLAAIKSEEPVEEVSQAVGIMQDVNKLMREKIYGHLSTESDTERRNSLGDILDTFYECNEKTLAVLDSLTTDNAKLEDGLAYAKKAGQLMVKDPTNAENIKACIIKAKQNLQTGSRDILPRMRKEIDESLQSYVDLLKKIEEISKKFKSAQDRVQFKKYGILAHVAAVAAGVVIVGICVAPTFALPAAFFYGVVGVFAFGIFYLAYIAWCELTRTNDRFEETIVLLKRLGDKDVDRVRSGVNFTRSAIIDLGNTLGQVETRIDIAAHYVRGQDAMNEAGHKLIEYCDKMERKSKALQEQIEILRTDVNEVQRSRYQYR